MVSGELYKYRSWSNRHHRRWLTDCEIYFARPDLLNDPYDGRLPLNFPWTDIKKTAANGSGALQNYLNQYPATEQVRARISNDVTVAYGKAVGMLSFSRNANSLLMWSNYASIHTGFCIAYDLNLLREEIKNKTRLLKNTATIGPKNVVYCKDFCFLQNELSHHERIIRAFTSKADEWQYEEEVRWVLFPSLKRRFKLHPRCIRGIILGANCKEPAKSAIIDQANKNGWQLLFARFSQEAFKIDIQTLR